MRPWRGRRRTSAWSVRRPRPGSSSPAATAADRDAGDDRRKRRHSARRRSCSEISPARRSSTARSVTATVCAGPGCHRHADGAARRRDGAPHGPASSRSTAPGGRHRGTLPVLAARWALASRWQGRPAARVRAGRARLRRGARHDRRRRVDVGDHGCGRSVPGATTARIDDGTIDLGELVVVAGPSRVDAVAGVVGQACRRSGHHRHGSRALRRASTCPSRMLISSRSAATSTSSSRPARRVRAGSLGSVRRNRAMPSRAPRRPCR